MTNFDLLVQVASELWHNQKENEASPDPELPSGAYRVNRAPITRNTIEMNSPLSFAEPLDPDDPEKYPLSTESILFEKYAKYAAGNTFLCKHADCNIQTRRTPKLRYSVQKMRQHVYRHYKALTRPCETNNCTLKLHDSNLPDPFEKPCNGHSVESEIPVSPEMNDCHMESKRPVSPKMNDCHLESERLAFSEMKDCDKESKQFAHRNHFPLNSVLSPSKLDSHWCFASPGSCYADETRRRAESDPQSTPSRLLNLYPHVDHDYFGLHDSISVKNGESDESDSKLANNQMMIDSPVDYILPQFVIKTPGFPYVHEPVGLDVSRIEEIDADGYAVEPRNVRKPMASSCLIHSVCNVDHRPKKPALRTRRSKQSSTVSVLGCVENQVKFRSGIHRVPRSADIVEATENSNLENFEHSQMQELAMKYAKQLKAKKKGRRNEPYVCKMCGATFTAKTTLLQHYYSKAGYKSYECDICHQRFTRLSSLTYHKQVHANINRFKCTAEDCSRGFRHPYHFKNHLADHKGPHTCSFCSSPSFKTINTFKRHLKMQHGKLLTSRGIEDIPKNRSNN